jgi:hypothetical protein
MKPRRKLTMFLYRFRLSKQVVELNSALFRVSELPKNNVVFTGPGAAVKLETKAEFK